MLMNVAKPVKIIRFLLVWALIGSIPAECRASLPFNGYLVVLPFYQKVQDIPFPTFVALPQKNTLLLNRLRLRPEILITDHLFFRLEYELDYLYSREALGFFYQLSTVNRRQYFNWQRTVLNRSHQQVRHYIDRLFLAWEWEQGRLVVGRQRISWGSGRIWNPTDLFNPLSPTAFDRIEKDGADAVNLQWYLGDFSDLQVVWNATRRQQEGNTAVRFRTHWRTTDLAILAGRFDRRWVVGGDFTTIVAQAAVRGEWLYDAGDATHDPFWKFIVGADNQWTRRLYTLVEYHFNGEGKTNPLQYEFYRLFQGEILNVGQRYAFAMVQFQLAALVNLSLAWSQNLDDHSGYWYPMLDVNAGENWAVSLGYQWFYGAERSEYGVFPRTAFLRAQLYF